MLPVDVHVPVAGSYSSAVSATSTLMPSMPAPATRTLPLGRSVAVWDARCRLMLPVVVQVPVAGSKSSADEMAWPVLLLLLRPPVTSTLPSGRSVAVW